MHDLREATRGIPHRRGLRRPGLLRARRDEQPFGLHRPGRAPARRGRPGARASRGRIAGAGRSRSRRAQWAAARHRSPGHSPGAREQPLAGRGPLQPAAAPRHRAGTACRVRSRRDRVIPLHQQPRGSARHARLAGALLRYLRRHARPHGIPADGHHALAQRRRHAVALFPVRPGRQVHLGRATERHPVAPARFRHGRQPGRPAPVAAGHRDLAVRTARLRGV